MEQWSDADAAYNDTLRLIEHSRPLDLLLATPDASELDIGSARQDIAFYTDLLPDQPPALQFQQAIADAQAARAAAAAGGQLVTERDIAAARGDAERVDFVARAELRQRREVLRRELERAERDIATAFAAAQTATSDTLEQLLESARSEALLQVAGKSRPQAHSPAHPRRGTVRARTPERRSAQIPGRTSVSARRRPRRHHRPRHRGSAVHPAQRRQRQRPVRCGSRLPTPPAMQSWPTPSPPSVTPTTKITKQQWALPPGAIVVIDDPATAEPAQPADIARHAATSDARVILLDPATSHGASSSALRLLTNSLPWNTTLSDHAAPDDLLRRRSRP